MSFRESGVFESSNTDSSHREFRPIRDLIEQIRDNRERRRQTRRERNSDNQDLQQPVHLSDPAQQSKRQSKQAQNHLHRYDAEQADSRSTRESADRGQIMLVSDTRPDPWSHSTQNRESQSSLQSKQEISNPTTPRPYAYRPEQGSQASLSTAEPQLRIGQIAGTQGLEQSHSNYMPGWQQVSNQRRGFYETIEQRGIPAPEQAEPEFTQTPSDFAFDREKIEEMIKNNENSYSDTISVKEKDGGIYEIADMPGQSTDSRLDAYLNMRGKDLSELDLSGSKISDSGLANLHKASGLKKLDLNNTDLDDKSLAVLAKQGLKQLNDLNLHATKIGDDGVASLKGLPIRSLNLADTVVTENCLGHLRGIKSLEVLNLDYSDIRDGGMRTVKDLGSLRSLSLKGCPLSDDSIQDLAKCQQLMLLNLEDTMLSPEKIRWLQEKMPRCVIVGPDGKGVSQGQTEPKQPFPLLRSLFGRKAER